jgi:hypothetical protein
MLINLNEPATWFSEPNDEGMSFTALEHALIYAMAVPAANRDSQARIVTPRGTTYGWDAIKHMSNGHDKLV